MKDRFNETNKNETIRFKIVKFLSVEDDFAQADENAIFKLQLLTFPNRLIFNYQLGFIYPPNWGYIEALSHEINPSNV